MLLDLLFPRRCLGCGRWGRYFCQDCLKEIYPFENQICPVCEKNSLGGLTHPGCQTKYSLDGLVSIFPYEGVMRQAIVKLKYRFITDLTKELMDLAETVLKKKKEVPKFDRSWVLIPVPLHSRRQRWRGFNQAEVFGRMLVEKFGWQFRTDILGRQRHTQPQVRLRIKERKKNIRGVFRINPHSQFVIPDSKFIIFDDIWTTGATMRECGQLLKKIGTREVWGLTLAR